MDAISYSYADKAQKRIKRFIENPDSNSGVLTQPKVIEAGETVTIKSGRQAILADTVVEGDLVIEAGGDVFVPAGAGFGDLESQISLKADTSYVDGKYSGFKNYIINGGFDVWQRGTSGVAAGFKADRWQDLYGGATQSWSRSTDVPSGSGAKYSIKYNGVNSLLYFTEAEVSKSLKGKTAVISCWMKTSTVIKGISIQKQNVFEGGLTGGYSRIAGVVIEYISSHTGDGTWQKVVTRYTFPNTSEMDNGLCIIDIATSDGTDSFATQVQLEEGSVATPFENRPIGLELSLCQRYYCVTYAYGRWFANAAGHTLETPIYWSTTMRVIPTTTLSGAAPSNCTAVLVATASVASSRLSLTSSAAGDAFLIGGTVTASAEL